MIDNLFNLVDKLVLDNNEIQDKFNETIVNDLKQIIGDRKNITFRYSKDNFLQLNIEFEELSKYFRKLHNSIILFVLKFDEIIYNNGTFTFK